VSGDTLPKRPRGRSWAEHDTAVYVVSTLNLVRTHRHSLPDRLTHFGITRYEVYSDLDKADVYFIELRRADGTIVGALVYRMGWLKPESVSLFTDRLGVQKAPRPLVEAYESDRKALIGSFTSTLPQADHLRERGWQAAVSLYGETLLPKFADVPLSR